MGRDVEDEWHGFQMLFRSNIDHFNPAPPELTVWKRISWEDAARRSPPPPPQPSPGEDELRMRAEYFVYYYIICICFIQRFLFVTFVWHTRYLLLIKHRKKTGFGHKHLASEEIRSSSNTDFDFINHIWISMGYWTIFKYFKHILKCSIDWFPPQNINYYTFWRNRISF